MCDAKIIPFLGSDTIACERDGTHWEHQGVLRDKAWPGSETKVTWQEDDRRTFHGEWPGYCVTFPICVLPRDHGGSCAS